MLLMKVYSVLKSKGTAVIISWMPNFITIVFIEVEVKLFPQQEELCTPYKSSLKQDF